MKYLVEDLTNNKQFSFSTFPLALSMLNVLVQKGCRGHIKKLGGGSEDDCWLLGEEIIARNYD